MIQSHIIKTKIRKYIVDNLLNGDSRGLEDHTHLIKSGVLDSFSLIEFILYIEEEFSLQLDHGQINMETFKNIDTITEMVCRALEV